MSLKKNKNKNAVNSAKILFHITESKFNKKNGQRNVMGQD